MNENMRALPKAKIEKSRFSWFLWLIPIAAALLCAWYVCHDYIFAGPTITIYFQNAEGLQEQNSLVQYRGVKIGEVETLKLTQDRQRVAVKAKLDTSAAGHRAGRLGVLDRSTRAQTWLCERTADHRFGELHHRPTRQRRRAPTCSSARKKSRLNPSRRWTSNCSPRNSIHCSHNRRFSIGAFRSAKCWIAVSATTGAKCSSMPALGNNTLRWCG